MEAPLQQHYREGKPAFDQQEVSALYEKAKLDSIKFNVAQPIDYRSEAMCNYVTL